MTTSWDPSEDFQMLLHSVHISPLPPLFLLLSRKIPRLVYRDVFW